MNTEYSPLTAPSEPHIKIGGNPSIKITKGEISLYQMF